MNKLFLAALLLSGFSLLSGCASAGRGTAPQLILVRNNMAQEVRQLVLSAPQRDRASPPRIATIAPVPRHKWAAMRRSETRGPLPNSVHVDWVDQNGGVYRQVIVLKDILKTATGSANEAFVVEVNPGNSVSITIQEISRGKTP